MANFYMIDWWCAIGFYNNKKSAIYQNIESAKNNLPGIFFCYIFAWFTIPDSSIYDLHSIYNLR